ncbi:unnamed protein product [Mytilus edulis]|uniref:Uncharacterized protein n=1 Tax=Mytilus edulis TaxID=6550 RepID=A0A8S3TR40_MYTED|nr:unnamed protein product [Mytilus edulis]
MLKREPDSTEFSTVFQKTTNMMHIHHSKEPLKTTANTLPLNNPGTGIQDNRLVETVMPITDTLVPENNTKTFTLFKPETGEVLIIKAEMNAFIIECETEAGDKQLFEGESIVKENDFEAAKTSKTNQREIKTQKSKPKEIKKMETKQNKEQEKEYTKLCDQVQGQPEKEKSQIGHPVFMYNQVTGEVQKVEIEIGNSNTSNGKEISTSRPSNGKASEAQSAFQNLLMNKMTNRCINDIAKQENIFPINNSGFDEEYSPSHAVSTASKHDDCTSHTPSMHQAPTASNHDDGHSTIDDQVIMVKNSNHTIKEQNQEIKKKNWYKYNYACGNCTSAFPRMIDLIKHHNTCERRQLLLM